MPLPKTILVATDFTTHADDALAFAVELAAQFDATVHLLHAVALPASIAVDFGIAYASILESATSDARTALDALATRYRDKASLAPVRLEVGDPREVIDRVAGAIGADLIVMGTHGRRGVRRFLMGSVAEFVVRTAPCAVLTIRPKHV